jgi:hypothetical protein
MQESNLVAAIKLVFKDTDLVVLQHLFSFYNSVSYCGILIIFACSGTRVASPISLSYFIVFSSILFGEYLSLQYVNSMNCTVSAGLGWFGGSALYEWLRMHKMSGLNLALHWHLFVWL